MLLSRDSSDILRLIGLLTRIHSGYFIVDLVLVEGYKYESYPKLEAYRTENKRVPFALTGNEIIAMASDTTHPDVNLPIFDLNKTSEIATFILTKVELI